MIKPITLKSVSTSGAALEASFLPEKGMNLCSYKLGGIEVIDQTTKEAFEQKYAGLGALIGPHFHRRKPDLIPKGLDEKKFPHILYFKGDEKLDPFTHGVGRYAPWHADFSANSFKARLLGKDKWNDVALSDLEGQDFEMRFEGELTPEGLFLKLSVESDNSSVVGIHYYYALPEGKGTIFSQVQNAYIINNEKKTLPPSWDFDSENHLVYPLKEDTDFTFFPYPDRLKSKMVLDTKDYQLITSYQSASEENSWQLWHPKGASFACVEPVSAANPRDLHLTASSIEIHLQILKK